MSVEFKLRILKLPYLCLQCIISCFNVHDVIHFSFASNTCRRIVKLTKHCPFDGITILAKKESIELCFRQIGNDFLEKWAFNLENLPNEKPFVRFEDGKELPTDLLTYQSYPFFDNDPVESARNCLELLISQFDERVRIVGITPEGSQKIFDVLNRLEIEQCFHFSIERNRILSVENDEGLSVFLEKTSIIHSAVFNIETSPNFSFNTDYCSPAVVCFIGSSGEWVTRDVLFGLRSKKIQASNCNLSKINGKDIIDFIDRWFEGADWRFTRIHIEWNTDHRITYKDFPKEFKLKKWSEKKRGRFVPLLANKKLDGSEGRDFKRADGLWATVLINNSRSIVFHVWYQRFSDFNDHQLVD